MGLSDYLLSKIPPEMVEKWGLDSISKDKNEDGGKDVPVDLKKLPIHTNFRLPITYLDSSDLHLLSPIVAQDLELIVPGSDYSIYEHLLQPTTTFGKNMVPSWSQYYTTSVPFLEDTQTLLSKVSTTQCSDAESIVPDYETFRDTWHALKEDKFFLEKYGYMEWPMLAQFNENASFLQCLSIINVVSPLISLFLPIIFIVLPFIILKIQRIPINFTVYLDRKSVV